MSSSVAPLPLGAKNIAQHAGWTMLAFVCSVTWMTAVVSLLGSLAWGPWSIRVTAISAVSALVISTAVSALATVLIGVPLVLGLGVLLRRNHSIAAHLWAAAGAGVGSAVVVVALYVVLCGQGEIDATFLYEPWIEFPWLAAAIALVALAGGSSTAGWLLTWRLQQCEQKPLRAALNVPY